jgi:hypothetical protein
MVCQKYFGFETIFINNFQIGEVYSTTFFLDNKYIRQNAVLTKCELHEIGNRSEYLLKTSLMLLAQQALL